MLPLLCFHNAVTKQRVVDALGFNIISDPCGTSGCQLLHNGVSSCFALVFATDGAFDFYHHISQLRIACGIILVFMPPRSSLVHINERIRIVSSPADVSRTLGMTLDGEQRETLRVIIEGESYTTVFEEDEKPQQRRLLKSSWEAMLKDPEPLKRGAPTCHTCADNMATIMFYPCGHLNMCDL